MNRKSLVLLLLALPSAASAAGISGTWHIQGPITPNCTFIQSGNNLGGACRGTGAEGLLSGTIDGQTAKWVFTRTNMNSGQRIAPVEFSATLSGTTLSGTITMNGGRNPQPFTAELLPNALPVTLNSAAPTPPAPQQASATPPAAATPAAAASSVNTAPPRTVFDIDLDGSAIHRQSGMICPVTVQGWARNGTIMYDKPGYDVSCGYRSPAGSEITIYLSRHAASVMNQAFESARDQIPKVRPNTHPRDGTATPPKGFEWLKAGFEMNEGETWSDLFFTTIPGWLFEARITYKPADLPAVNATFADLAAAVTRTAGKQQAACEASAPPQRGGKRITDPDEIRGYAVSAAQQAKAVITASRSGGNWCAEGNTTGTTTSDYWRNIAVDAKAPAYDRLTGVDSENHIVVAGNAAANALAAKNGATRQVYDVFMERKDDIVVVAEFDGRPSPADLVKEILSQRQIPLYAAVNKATSNISFFNPAPPPPPAPAQ